MKRNAPPPPPVAPAPAPPADDRIEQLRQEILSLMTIQAKTSRNVVVNNLQPLTEELIQEHLEHLTLNFIQCGAKGFADFANNYPFKDRILCTDRSRRKLRYLDEAGELIDDGGGTRLTQRFFQAIAPRNEELINEEYNVIQRQVHDIAREGRAHSADLTNLLTKATQLQDTLRLCKQAAEGGENELTDGFIRHLTKIL